MECAVCGGHSFKYDPIHRRRVCNYCGTPAPGDASEEMQLQYEETVANASAHLRAGNWDRALNMLKSLTDGRPDDVSLYRMILKCATKNYKDQEVEDEARREAARDAWDKLANYLHGMDPAMRVYGNTMYRAKMDRIRKKKAKASTWLFGAVLCFLIGATALLNEAYFIGFLTTSLGLYSVTRCFEYRPDRLHRQQSEAYRDDWNPFEENRDK